MDATSFYNALKRSDAQKVLTLVPALQCFSNIVDVTRQIRVQGFMDDSLKNNVYAKYTIDRKKHDEISLQILTDGSVMDRYHTIERIFAKTSEFISLQQELSSRSLEATRFSNHQCGKPTKQDKFHTRCHEELMLKYFTKPGNQGRIETVISVLAPIHDLFFLDSDQSLNPWVKLY